jgi:hypothetical protein
MSKYDHSHVRLRFLASVFRTCVLPAAVLEAALRVTDTHLGYLTAPSHILFISLLLYLKALYTNYVVSREARRLGARPIPHIVGKWPGNIDILFRLLADLKSGYMQDIFLELFHEYQSTTLNLRILWTDKVWGVFMHALKMYNGWCT